MNAWRTMYLALASANDFRGLDLKTGEPAKQINTQGPKVLANCERRRRQQDFRIRIARHACLRWSFGSQRPALPQHARRQGAVPDSSSEVNALLSIPDPLRSTP